MTWQARALRLAGNASILVTTALRHAQDDPALLAVQTVRRLPRGVRERAAGVIESVGRRGSSTARAAAAFLTDHPAQARALLEGAPPAAGWSRRVRDELAVQVGLEPSGHPAAQARAAWNRGDLSGAVEILARSRGIGERHLRERLASELATMQPGFWLRGLGSASGSVGAQQDSARPLHLLTNSLPHTQSGYTLRSHAVLRGQQAAGLDPRAATRIGYPVVVGTAFASDVDVVDGIEYHRSLPAVLASTPAARLEQNASSLAALAERVRATVLHTTTHFPNALVTEAVSRHLGLPWVYEVRGQLEKTWVASRPEGDRAAAEASERYRLARERETEMCLSADHVVVLSESVRDDLGERGVPHARMTLVPNGVDDALLTRSTRPDDARGRLGLDPAGFWVGTVSSLVDYEGLDTVLRAVASLRAAGADVRAAIVGDGVSRPSLLRLRDELGLREAVVMPGRVDRSDAVQWHEALDVFVVPRRDTEVCRTVTPLKPVEAMALGRPVIASDLPALAEIVAVPGSGLVCAAGDVLAWADSIETLRRDPDRAADLGAAGRRFAAARTWTAMGKRYASIYDRVRSTR